MSTPLANLMVVDDDPEFLENCEAALTAAGYRVILALTGGQSRSLTEALGHTLDLALIDLVMPDENGLEIIRSFRQTAPELRVIAISEHASPADLETAEYFGATATLRKPISPEWLTTIQRALGERPRDAAMRREA